MLHFSEQRIINFYRNYIAKLNADDEVEPDPGEKNDLSVQHPQETSELAAAWRRWSAQEKELSAP